jgi:putative transposase
MTSWSTVTRGLIRKYFSFKCAARLAKYLSNKRGRRRLKTQWRSKLNVTTDAETPFEKFKMQNEISKKMLSTNFKNKFKITLRLASYVKFKMVEELNTVEGVTVSLGCDTLDVSRSGYYAWLSRPVPQRAEENTVLLERIRAIHEKSDRTYGSPRVTADLRAEGFVVNEKRVARLMRENEIASDAVKKFRIATTDSNHDLPVAERLFETEHADKVMAPNQVWAGDITYVATDEGWLFLAIFLDIFTRKVVGFSCDDNMQTELILKALEMALGRQPVGDGELIAHSDRGSQYASDAFNAKLRLAGIIASMSRKGNCYDNAHVESFFHSLKTELVYRRNFKTREEAKQVIFEWIETWYNRQRRHSALGYMTPIEYEKLAS